jgi:hypothetical protein
MRRRAVVKNGMVQYVYSKVERSPAPLKSMKQDLNNYGKSCCPQTDIGQGPLAGSGESGRPTWRIARALTDLPSATVVPP